MLRTIVNYLSFVFAGFFLIAAAAVMQLWPASWWLEVRTVRVFDARQGHQVPMAVDRTINRDFRGEWTASIRRLENGGWVAYCSAKGQTNYSADSLLPDPLTLKWWTYPDCHPLPPGKYVMRTSWLIKDTNLLPDKEVVSDSNIFEILP